MRKPLAIDLFSGCGGLTQGLRDAGFRVIAGIELDGLAVKTYKANHPGTKVWQSDIRKLVPEVVMEHHRIMKGELDILAGCPPCQAFSTLTNKNGGRRVYAPDSKDLIFRFMDYAEAFYPKVIMLENVPRMRNDYRMAKVKRQLRELGYEGEPVVLNAADYGVPQRRKRMILIASRIGSIEYAKPLSHDLHSSVRLVIHSLPRPKKSGDPLHDYKEGRSERIKALIKSIPKDGGSRKDLGADVQLDCHQRCNGFKDVYGRMAWDEVSPTITGSFINPSKGRFLHPSQNRAITLREGSLIQSFSATYKFHLDKGKYATAKMIGNAFPPAFVRPHAENIKQHLQFFASKQHVSQAAAQ